MVQFASYFPRITGPNNDVQFQHFFVSVIGAFLSLSVSSQFRPVVAAYIDVVAHQTGPTITRPFFFSLHLLVVRVSMCPE